METQTATTTSAADLIARLASDAEAAFTRESEDAARVLQSLIQTATRELANLQAGQLVSIDWIEQDANRYHDHLAKMTEQSRMVSATRYALRILAEGT